MEKYQNRSLKVATFNANSVRVRMPIIIGWLKQEEPDVLCLQETKVQDMDFPVKDFQEAGYRVIFRGQKSYNGVAIASRNQMDSVRRDLYDQGDEQARFLSIRTLGVKIVNVYVPQGFAPGTDKFAYKLNWLRGLLSHIKKNYKPDDPLLILGDFNVALEPIDLYDPEGMNGEAGYHPDERELMREFFEWGLVDLFRKFNRESGHYTFWDYRIPNGFKRNRGWRIDYILATDPMVQKSNKIWTDVEPRRLPKPSDHTFLTAEFKISI